MANIESWQNYDITVSRYVEDYINDFSEDDDCVALWRFEAAALLEDSKGNNDWYIYPSSGPVDPAADTVIFKEGASSVYFDGWGNVGPPEDNSPSLYILDTGLDAGFPLKSGDATKQFSICFWIKLDSFDTSEEEAEYYNAWFKKGVEGGSHCSLAIQAASVDEGVTHKVKLMLSSTGASYDAAYTHASALATGVWYHVAVTYGPGTYRIRIWDDTAQAILGADAIGAAIDTHVDDGWCWLGSPVYDSDIDGHVDEMVIFKRVLTVEEIDKIRQGVFP